MPVYWWFLLALVADVMVVDYSGYGVLLIYLITIAPAPACAKTVFYLASPLHISARLCLFNISSSSLGISVRSSVTLLKSS